MKKETIVIPALKYKTKDLFDLNMVDEIVDAEREVIKKLKNKIRSENFRLLIFDHGYETLVLSRSTRKDDYDLQLSSISNFDKKPNGHSSYYWCGKGTDQDLYMRLGVFFSEKDEFREMELWTA